MERKFSDQELARRAKLEELQKEGKNPYEVEGVKNTINSKVFLEKFANLKEEEHDNQEWVISGRIVAIRQTFGVIRDFYGKLQFYINKNEYPEVFEHFKKFVDLGDIVKITGTAFRTQKGEITIRVKTLEIISKALKPLPEKWHGLQDEELRASKK